MTSIAALNEILEQDGDNELSRQDLIQAIAAYGITIRGNDFTIEQLMNILAALEATANRLLELAQDCPCADVSNLDATGLFRQAYEPIQLRYNPDENKSDPPQVGGRTYASVERFDGIQIIELVPDTFTSESVDAAHPNLDIFRVNSDSFREQNPDEIIQRIIIHELSHAFHNNLLAVQGAAVNYDFNTEGVQVEPTGYNNNVLITIPRIEIGVGDSAEVFTNMRIEVGRDTPMVVIDYLIATGGYWSGLGFDDGAARGLGLYTADEAANDSTIVLLTNLVYEEYKGTPSCTNCNLTDYLVDLNGSCLRDSQGNCLPLDGNHLDKKYVRLPKTYFRSEFAPVISDNLTIRNYFSNEAGDTSIPQPQEGFADILTYHIIEGADTITEDPRGRFVVDNFCDWLCSLLNGG